MTRCLSKWEWSSGEAEQCVLEEDHTGEHRWPFEETSNKRLFEKLDRIIELLEHLFQPTNMYASPHYPLPGDPEGPPYTGPLPPSDQAALERFQKAQEAMFGDHNVSPERFQQEAAASNHRIFSVPESEHHEALQSLRDELAEKQRYILELEQAVAEKASTEKYYTDAELAFFKAVEVDSSVPPHAFQSRQSAPCAECGLPLVHVSHQKKENQDA